MKLAALNSILAVLLAGVVSFFIADYGQEQNQIMVAVGCFISICATAIPALAMRYPSERISIVGRASSAAFMIAAIVTQAIYSAASATSISLYILITASVVIAHLLVLSAVMRSGQ